MTRTPALPKAPRPRVVLAWIALAACAFSAAAKEGTPDPLAFMPPKEAARARQALDALDASLAAWRSLEEAYAAEVRKVRGALASAEDSGRLKALLEAGEAGTWKAARGPDRAAVRDDVRKRAGQLSALLEPRLAGADPAALAAISEELLRRARDVPGAVPEYLAFAERLLETDAPGRRYAVRALLGLLPEEMVRRLAPPGDGAGVPYASDPELTARADGLRNLRDALAALQAGSPVLGVPERPWSEAERQQAQTAARALSRLEPASRGGVLRAAARPGLTVLPAFLSGLSPEELRKWSRDQGCPPGVYRVFLSCAYEEARPAGGPVRDVSENPTDPAFALAELERDIAKGLTGPEFLARLTDPALRLALRGPTAPAGVRQAWDRALEDLTARLGTELARSGGAADPGAYRVEAGVLPGVPGFTALRAYRTREGQAEAPVPAEDLERALSSALAGSPASPVEIGLVPADSAPTEPLRLPASRTDPGEASPSGFAARTVYGYSEFRGRAESAGIPPAALIAPELGRFTALCEARCLGTAGDAEVARALDALGGPRGAADYWTGATETLEWAVRALAVYAGPEGRP